MPSSMLGGDRMRAQGHCVRRARRRRPPHPSSDEQRQALHPLVVRRACAPAPVTAKRPPDRHRRRLGCSSVVSGPAVLHCAGAHRAPIGRWLGLGQVTASQQPATDPRARDFAFGAGVPKLCSASTAALVSSGQRPNAMLVLSHISCTARPAQFQAAAAAFKGGG